MEQTDIEKSGAQTLQREKSSDTDSVDPRISALSPEEQKRVIRRIDYRLVLTLGFMYCVSLMDRTNLGVAAVAGMNVDLMLIGFRYSIITLVFFITYVLLQPAATVVLRKVGPRIFLPVITMAWGIVMICFGFVKVWTEMVGLRLLLGVLEAGFFPGAAYVLSCWYPRYDLQKRYAVFYLIGSLSSAFSGIMAFGFDQMSGLGNLGPDYGKRILVNPKNPALGVASIQQGIAGWRWIFIMQGILTCIAAAIGAFTIADFPEKAATKSKSLAMAFLTQREADFVVARIEKDRSDAIAEPFKLGAYMKGALDLKIWAFAALFGLTTTVTYAIAYFLPQILTGMGFTAGAAQCLIAPPYVVAAIWMYICAIYGDKWHLRGPFVIFNALLGVIGIPLLGFSTNNAVRYFGVFLATTSANANIPTVLSYQANNIRGQWKRALASATLVGMGGVGGIIGSTVFRSEDAPKYLPGMYTCIIASGLVIPITLALDWKFHRANKRAAAGGKIIEGLEGFRYTL